MYTYIVVCTSIYYYILVCSLTYGCILFSGVTGMSCWTLTMCWLGVSRMSRVQRNVSGIGYFPATQVR